MRKQCCFAAVTRLLGNYRSLQIYQSKSNLFTDGHALWQHLACKEQQAKRYNQHMINHG